MCENWESFKKESKFLEVKSKIKLALDAEKETISDIIYRGFGWFL